MAITLKDVAQRAGVSVPTASRVLSGSSYPVVEELRLRVRQAAEELDYVPNAQAQGLLRGNTGTIGVLVGDVGDPYFSEIVNGIHERATVENLLVTICHTERDPDRELGYFRMLQSHRAHSVILAGSGLNDESYRAGIDARVRSFRAAGGHVVAIGTPVVAVDRVLVDNRDGGRMLGRHLIDLGHRDVALISGPATLVSTEERLGGLKEALDEAGARLIIHHGPSTRDEGYRAAGELLARHPELTAITGTADQMAIGAMSQLRDQGRSVPEDISVAGFNDIAVSRDLSPSLTTVRLPLREMGSAALDIALSVDREIDAHPVERQLGVELVVRGSTGPVREGAGTA
ncbi:LacI family DNA-binding transcriptional regulator [Brachybacterium sp. AOP29-B2-41]|uniref:LacI family DNA-binding transcriptional regulator n=1 Tax=Brachybacterium sp. AOP29-B2-41 TaxID=3457704 RepID=UPI004033C0E3